MDYDRISDFSLWLLQAVVIGVPIWLVFRPPRWVRARSLFLRWLVAVLATQALVYLLFYCALYPMMRAYHTAHPADILDGILLYPPWVFCAGAAIVAFVLLAFRSISLKPRDSQAHYPSDITGANV